MQVTETQAAKLICPFAQGFNFGQRLCAASACMAWDWVEEPFEYYHGLHVGQYRGSAYFQTAFWPEGSLPLGDDWTWEPAAIFRPTQPTSTGWWRRPKLDRLGQCGRTIILEIQTA